VCFNRFKLEAFIALQSGILRCEREALDLERSAVQISGPSPLDTRIARTPLA
jgi:hypothetical protein